MDASDPLSFEVDIRFLSLVVSSSTWRLKKCSDVEACRAPMFRFDLKLYTPALFTIIHVLK